MTYTDKTTGDEWPSEAEYIQHCLMVDQIRARNKSWRERLKEHNDSIKKMYNGE